jgi:hypothetical protein
VPDPNGFLFGGGWLVEDCATSRLDLYSLAAGSWSSIEIAAGCQRFDPGPGSACEPYAVGADWIEYDESSTQFGDRFVFQNIASGILRPDPANSRTLADLSSPGLAHRLCNPLVTPRYGGGLIGLTGRMVLVNSGAGATLERCGSRLHEVLPFDAGFSYDTWSKSDTSAILFTSDVGPVLNGIFVPSLRPFRVVPILKRRVDRGNVSYDYGDRHIYIDELRVSSTSLTQRVLAAPLPEP